MRVASLWRAYLYKIGALQQAVFEGSTTEQTIYDPEDGIPGYLYPTDPKEDYTEFGIFSGKPDQEVLPKFKLYDVTRRAINCLSLLYVNPIDALVPTKITGFQATLIQKVSAEAQVTPSEGTVQASDATPAPTVASGASRLFTLQETKDAVTDLLCKFLDAWDGYLRERYYTGGRIPNTGYELTAYEGGRSMAWLSWNITVATIEYERADQARTDD